MHRPHLDGFAAHQHQARALILIAAVDAIKLLVLVEQL
jgi:hypothetical protein